MSESDNFKWVSVVPWNGDDLQIELNRLFTTITKDTAVKLLKRRWPGSMREKPYVFVEVKNQNEKVSYYSTKAIIWLETVLSMWNNVVLKTLLDQNEIVEILLKDEYIEYIEIVSREEEILKAIENGITEDWIPNHLSISETTYNTHKRNLFRKYKVSSREDAIQIYHRMNQWK